MSRSINATGDQSPKVLVIACGALAHEISDVVRASNWSHVSIRCLPPELHNRPERIPAAVRGLIEEGRPEFECIFVAYGDCGTGGLLDRVLEQEGVERIPGAHCYEFFAGGAHFNRLADAEPGTFYLTDFLTRHFDRLVWHGLGLDRHPELQEVYFTNYRRLVFLAQRDDESLTVKAREVATLLGLEFERVFTGYGDLERSLSGVSEVKISWQN